MIHLEPLRIPVILTSSHPAHPADEETPDYMERGEDESGQNALNDLARRGDNVAVGTCKTLFTICLTLFNVIFIYFN